MSEPVAKKSKQETVLITGGQGFFGAYMVKSLLKQGATPIVMDMKENNMIFEQIMSAEEMGSFTRIFGNIADAELIEKIVLEHKPTSIIHLAGLQIPTCRGNPKLGATVNVIGTINVFEAAVKLKEATGTAPQVVYASSAAILGPKEDYATTPVPDDQYHKPKTLYGVFKLCNEGTARIYAQDHGINSVGLRPYTCFGVGREVGLTSAPTKAIKAAVLGRKFEIGFSGFTGFSYIEDIARIFIGCSRAPAAGAHFFNIRGDVDTVENFVKIMSEVLPAAKDLITVTGNEITIMYDVDESGLQAFLDTLPEHQAIAKPFPLPMADCIKETAESFVALQKAGKLTDRDLV